MGLGRQAFNSDATWVNALPWAPHDRLVSVEVRISTEMSAWRLENLESYRFVPAHRRCHGRLPGRIQLFSHKPFSMSVLACCRHPTIAPEPIGGPGADISHL